jgi:ElaB/YqjD/DUF883 family membrane-anchored ribosome-binding protein
MSDVGSTRQETEGGQTPEGGQAPQGQTPEELRRDIEQTRAELGDTVDALSQKADVKGQIQQKVEERKAALRGRQEELKAKATQARGRVSGATPEDAKRTAAQVARTAEERPVPAIAVAFGAGLLVGWLVKRR